MPPTDPAVDDDHHASWRGVAVEHLVAATVALIGRGRINVAQTLWDAEGVDLLFDGPNHAGARMQVQVKSISSMTANVTQRNTAVALVRDATFRVRDDVWLLFVLVDMHELTFYKSWLVPSADFAELTNINSHGRRRFADSINSQNSKWTSYRFDCRTDLARAVAERLDVSVSP
jgi:hypothetical protein